VERDLPIIVYSHLRWSAVFQREQQQLTHLATQRPVYFFEETLAAEPLVPDSIELQYPKPNLVVIRPILEKFSGPFDLARLAPITKRFLRWQRVERHIAWVQTPLAAPLAQALSPVLLIDSRNQLPVALESARQAAAPAA
jgi:UDP-galactopyranose mutase